MDFCFSEDKTINFLHNRHCHYWAGKKPFGNELAGTTFLACFKWMGGFFLPSLVVETIRNKGVNSSSYLFVGSLLCLLVVNIPWFPKNLVVFQRRSNRMNFDPPMHLSITRLLSEIGLYDPLIPKVGIPLILVVIFGLHLKERLTWGSGCPFHACFLPPVARRGSQSYSHDYAAVSFDYPGRKLEAMENSISQFSDMLWLVYNTFAQTDQHRASLPALNHLFGGPNSIGELLIGNAFLITVLASYLKTRFLPWMDAV